MVDVIVDGLVAVLLLIGVIAGLLSEQRGGVGKNPPLSDEARAAMDRFLAGQETHREE